MKFIDFKNSLKEQLAIKYTNIDDSEYWELKVPINDELVVKMELKEIWDKFEEDKDRTIITNFVLSQINRLRLLDLNNTTYEELKKSLLPLIRSKKNINANYGEVDPIQKDLDNEFHSVVFLDYADHTVILDKAISSSLPEDEEVYKDALNNLYSRGWEKESEKTGDESYEILAFNGSHSTHHQFFIKEWLENEVGECYIALPTNRIGLLLKIKSNDCEEWINNFSFFVNLVEEIYNEQPNPLSKSIIKFQNGKYEYLESKIG